MKRVTVILLCIFITIFMLCSAAMPSTLLYDGELLYNNSVSVQSSYSLQWNVQAGNWKDEYYNYNCYAYALGLTDKFYGPGEFAYGASTFAYTDTIAKIASDVKADLMSTGTNGLNNKCVKMTTVCPTSVPTGYSCICVRKGEDYLIPSDKDFHFMRYDGSDWYHKPSGSNPLRYTEEMSASVPWYGEVSIKNVASRNRYNYFGTIYYFTYAAEHTYSAVWTENHYHSNKEGAHYYEFKYTCKNCGDSYTEWSSAPCLGGTHCITPWNLKGEPLAA